MTEPTDDLTDDNDSISGIDGIEAFGEAEAHISESIDDWREQSTGLGRRGFLKNGCNRHCRRRCERPGGKWRRQRDANGHRDRNRRDGGSLRGRPARRHSGGGLGTNRVAWQ
jgi:hypothetical protein